MIKATKPLEMPVTTRPTQRDIPNYKNDYAKLFSVSLLVVLIYSGFP
jgi:hypothetical protein